MSKTKVNYASSISKTSTTLTLPDAFVPGKFDVICSQGRKAKTHAGNIYYQSVIEKLASKYANAIGKRPKSSIVSVIIRTIQEKCHSTDGGGGFVKVTDGRWGIVENEAAREKVSQSLRDVLAGQYRSSLVSKKRRRRESNLKMIVDFDEIIKSNQFVSTITNQLANKIKTFSLSEDYLLQLMTQTNTKILRQLKQDRSVQRKVQQQQQQQQAMLHCIDDSRNEQNQRQTFLNDNEESSSLKHKSKRLKNWSYEEIKYNLCFE